MNPWFNIQFGRATANGRGAIASIIVLGENCLDLINEPFRPIAIRRMNIDHVRRPVYGRWHHDGCPGEDLIVCPISSGHIEIHCHGGDTAIEAICQSLRQRGARFVEPEELFRLIFGSEYLADFHWQISRARTSRVLDLMLEQQTVQEDFFRLLLHAIETQDQALANQILAKGSQWAEWGGKAANGWSIVICGKPNVGKSSLINKLVGFERAIVDDQAGTTRDIVQACSAIDGWPVQFVDTAGLRATSNPLEKEGIRLAEAQIDFSDLVLLVVDAANITESELEEQVASWKPDIVVANKSDLRKFHAPGIDVAVSARTGDGLSKLMELIGSRIVPWIPGEDDFVAISEFQQKRLELLVQQINSSLWDQAAATIQELGIPAISV